MVRHFMLPDSEKLPIFSLNLLVLFRADNHDRARN